MAIVRPITDKRAFDEWVAERPPVIREMVAKCPPDRLYRMVEGGMRCTIYSYNENGTVTVEVTGEFNRVLFGRIVFGVSLDSLVECDPPGPDEDVGDTAAEAGYTEDDVRRLIIPEVAEYIKLRRGKD